MSALFDENVEVPTRVLLITTSSQKLRILVATEFLPPYVSGIANRCKNLIKGYRDQGHTVTVASVAGTACDMVVPSILNPIYTLQRAFIFPPLLLLWQLLNFTQPVPYDIVHIVGPIAWPFAFLTPLFKLRGVAVYVSYHVTLQHCYDLYFSVRWLVYIAEPIFLAIYFIPLVWFADMVGVPSEAADTFVFKYSKKVHIMKSGIDTELFVPWTGNNTTTTAAPASVTAAPVLSEKQVMANALQVLTNGKAEKEEQHAKAVEEPCPPHPDHAPISRSNTPPPPHESHEDSAPAYSTTDPITSQLPAATGPTLCYIGRLAPEKNVEFLVAAMSHPNLSDATLVIVGDGPRRAALEKLAVETVGIDNVFPRINENAKREKNTNDLSAHARRGKSTVSSPFSSQSSTTTSTGPRIVFTGMLLSEHAVRTHYARSSIFVTASASETFGFTVAEAMACGTPSVCVRSGAFPKVYSMINDWMFTEGDVEGYVSCMRKVLGEGQGARTKSRRIAVQKFSVKMAVGDLLMAYEECVNETRGVKKVL
ncbi:Sulfoquinovosyl transferase sqd2 [Rhizophlyctis rosea]|uniref:Sulfoquinovosyl transferase sqd2 n=1 Tax=Rhizophlyctis rosea TaxID=64517 RepID=A0AAD5SJ72_9FUNG|nr:Sulfoquinovosyl transferase sqd2 [Rhizophlyctis rosea]